MVASEASKGIDQFRLNPFRVLQVPSKAKLDDALWQSEKILGLMKLGLQPKGLNVLPWLSNANELEVRQALQKIEEPFQRIIEQLLWFDFEEDPYGKLLKEALLEQDGEKIKLYLDIVDDKLHVDKSFREKNKETKSHEIQQNNSSKEKTKLPPPLPMARLKTITPFINRVNLEFLLAITYFHNVGPLVKSDQKNGVVKGVKKNTFSWKKSGGFLELYNAHDFVSNGQSNVTEFKKWEALLSSALLKWQYILEHSLFKEYIIMLTDTLQDDLLDESVVEIIKESIPTRLSDILLTELKISINYGQKDKTKTLLKVIADSLFFKTKWKNAFSPLRQYYQIELSDLYDLIEDKEHIKPQVVQLYLNRLEKVKRKWNDIDGSGVLGLHHLIDESVIKAFNLITSMNYSGKNLGVIQSLLLLSTKVAATKSVKSRIENYKNQIKENFEYLTCHYCKERESDPDHPVILKGKKELRREWNGNGTTIHYSLKNALVSRCHKCTGLHNYILEYSRWLTISIMVSIFIWFCAITEFLEFIVEGGWFLMLFGILFLVYPYIWMRYMFDRLIASVLTDSNEYSLYDIDSSKGSRDLKKEGYYIENINAKKSALAEFT